MFLRSGPGGPGRGIPSPPTPLPLRPKFIGPGPMPVGPPPPFPFSFTGIASNRSSSSTSPCLKKQNSPNVHCPCRNAMQIGLCCFDFSLPRACKVVVVSVSISEFVSWVGGPGFRHARTRRAGRATIEVEVRFGIMRCVVGCTSARRRGLTARRRWLGLVHVRLRLTFVDVGALGRLIVIGIRLTRSRLTLIHVRFARLTVISIHLRSRIVHIRLLTSVVRPMARVDVFVDVSARSARLARSTVVDVRIRPVRAGPGHRIGSLFVDVSTLRVSLRHLRPRRVDRRLVVSIQTPAARCDLRWRRVPLSLRTLLAFTFVDSLLYLIITLHVPFTFRALSSVIHYSSFYFLSLLRLLILLLLHPRLELVLRLSLFRTTTRRRWSTFTDARIHISFRLP